MSNHIATTNQPILDDKDSTPVARFTKAIRTIEGMSGTIYIDMQFLNSDQGDIIKEISLRCFGSPAATIIVKSPFGAWPRYMENKHCMDHVHGITWNMGCIDLSTLRNLLSNLFNSDRMFAVKGKEKMEILEGLGLRGSQFKLVEEFPNLESLREVFHSAGCSYHRELNKDFACTEKNSYALMSYDKDWDI